MNPPLRLSRCVGWLGIVLATTAGCTGVGNIFRPSGGISQQRRQRHEEAERGFNVGRDFAEFQSAADRWQQQDISGCKQQLGALLARNPDHHEGLLLMVEVCLAGKQYAAATQYVERALKNRPDDARGHYLAALVLDADGKNADAMAHYRRAVELEPGEELYRMGHDTALPSAPGMATVTDGRVIPAAHQVAPAAALVVPQPDGDPSQAAISSAMAALRHNRPEEAVRLLQATQSRLGPSIQGYRILGAAYYRLGDYRSSQVALGQALSLDNTNALTYFLLGCTASKLEEHAAAEAYFARARTLDPKYAVTP